MSKWIIINIPYQNVDENKSIAADKIRSMCKGRCKIYDYPYSKFFVYYGSHLLMRVKLKRLEDAAILKMFYEVGEPPYRQVRWERRKKRRYHVADEKRRISRVIAAKYKETANEMTAWRQMLGEL